MQEVFISTGFEFGFLFCMRTENAIDPVAFKPFFNDLPVDPNIKGHYRYRRLSRFRITEAGVMKLPHGYLFQSKEYNPVVGDIKREFEELRCRNCRPSARAFWDPACVEILCPERRRSAGSSRP